MKAIFICLLVFFTISAKSQNITSTEFMKLSKMSFDAINSLLLKKGWRYYGQSEKDDTTTVKWGFLPSYYTNDNIADKASSWFIITAVRDTMQFFSYQFGNKSIYNGFMNMVKLYGFKKVGGYMQKEMIVSFFESKKNKYTVVVNSKQENVQPFNIQIFNK